ncbi:MAG: hypothetical protein IT271_13790 [Chitinophagales bacterium]|nr:hypothetical protein [Chitinophagales bacterium]
MDFNQFLIKAGRKVYNKVYPNSRIKVVKDNYDGKKILSMEDGNNLIARKLQSGEPLMVCRLGATETGCIENYIHQSELRKAGPLERYFRQVKGDSAVWENRIRDNMRNWSGFFPQDDASLDRFSRLYLDLIPDVDVLAVWYNPFEEEIYRRYCPDAALVPLKSIESYYFEQPWTQFLEGKKVLVIHPFDISIKEQYQQKRALLFRNKLILPAFELHTIKAVQTLVDNNTAFPTWFDALEDMRMQMEKMDFDILLVGAGAYGLPLAAYAKRMGKQAIHFGGALQILFGIRGNRWDNIPEVNSLYNEHWVRPVKEETPATYKKVEGGSYW